MTEGPAMEVEYQLTVEDLEVFFRRECRDLPLQRPDSIEYWAWVVGSFLFLGCSLAVALWLWLPFGAGIYLGFLGALAFFRCSQWRVRALVARAYCRANAACLMRQRLSISPE